MFSHSKVKCGCPACPHPHRSLAHSTEPCVPNEYGSNRIQAMHNPLRGHPMNNPEILASVREVDYMIQGPAANPSYDCSMTQQKIYLAHPLYHKKYMKTFNTQNYPVHYTVPPVDYKTYLKRQYDVLCSQYGNHLENKCYMNTRDLERARNYQEYLNKNRPCKPLGVCQNCKSSRKLKKILPHCCSCTCAYNLNLKLAWENKNCALKQRQRQQESQFVDAQKVPNLPIKKSYYSKAAPPKEPDDYICKSNNKQEDGENERNSEDEDDCPCDEEAYQSVPSEYRRSYQHTSSDDCSYKSKNFKSTGTKLSKHKPGWNKSIKAKQIHYVPTLANVEAKLDELQNILDDAKLQAYPKHKKNVEVVVDPEPKTNLEVVNPIVTPENKKKSLEVVKPKPIPENKKKLEAEKPKPIPENKKKLEAEKPKPIPENKKKLEAEKHKPIPENKKKLEAEKPKAIPKNTKKLEVEKPKSISKNKNKSKAVKPEKNQKPTYSTKINPRDLIRQTLLTEDWGDDSDDDLED